MRRLNLIKILITGTVFILIIATGTSAFARPPLKRPRPLPAPRPIYQPIIVGTNHFYFRSGAFFRKGPRGYLPVAPPRGAVIRFLPHGYSIRIVAGAKYYYFNDVYYTSASNGYMVVPPPVSTTIEKDTEIVKLQGEVSVTTEILNVRSGPGSDYSVISLVYKGEILKAYDESTNWIYVELPSGELGWVMKEYINTINARPVG